MIPSKYKIFFLVLSICVGFSACQTATDKQQQEAEQKQLQSQLDKVTKELDSLKKAATSSKEDTSPKKKKKPSPTPKVRKKEPVRKVVSTPKTPAEHPTTSTPTVRREPTILSPPVTVPPSRDRSNEIDALQAAIQQERQSMLQAKDVAQSADAPNWASESYEEAIATEQMGEDNARQLTNTSLKEASTNFATASSLFQQATEEAEQVVAEKTEADQAKSAMLAIRRTIGNGSRNPSTIASYKEAIVLEEQGLSLIHISEPTRPY